MSKISKTFSKLINKVNKMKICKTFKIFNNKKEMN